MKKSGTIGALEAFILALCLTAAACTGCSRSTAKEVPAAETAAAEETTVQTTEAAAASGAEAGAEEEAENYPRVRCRVYRIDASDGYDEYQILYYAPATNYLMELTDELHLYKSVGYTMDALEQADVDKAYPGFSTFSFTESELLEDEEKVCWILRFRRLDDPDNLRTLHENGVLTVTDPDSGAPISAESYFELLETNGAELVAEDSYEELDLHIDTGEKSANAEEQ